MSNYCKCGQILLAAAALTLGLGTAPTRAAQDDAKPGLVGEYFQLRQSPSDFPKLAGKQPFLVRVDRQINFPESDGEFHRTKLSENFYVLWTGSLRIDKPGEYTFYTESDDGSRLSIDGKIVVDNGGPHSFSEKSGKTELSAGEHAVRIEFFQGGGGAGCVVSWQPPDGKKQVIPAAAFSHPASAEAVAWDAKKWRRARRLGGSGTSWDNLDYGPFLSSTVVANMPGDNMTYKGVSVKLGNVTINGQSQPAAVCFDTQLMRMSAGWVGGFLTLRNVAFTGDHGPSPVIAGDQKFGTRNAPAWAQKDGSFTDPRLALYGEPFGGMPRDYLHYKGLYRHGEQVVFSYSVNGMDVLETPGTNAAAGDVAFTRTFEMGPSNVAQTTIVAEADSAKGWVGAPGAASGTASKGGGDQVAVLESADSRTAVGLIQPPPGATFSVVPSSDGKGQDIRLTVPPHAAALKFTLVIWGGAADGLAHFGEHLKGQVADVNALTQGGPSHWKQELQSEGKLAVEPTRDAAKAAYVLDELTPPQIPSNWPELRFGGFDFFPDGHSAAICTWNGDVYIVKGIDDKLEHLTWRRIAGGMFQTLGLKIIDNKIYVHGRDQITILHDLDGDGEADFYENFNNDVAITDHFHEFAFDLQQDKAGNLYIIKAGGVNPGGQGFQRPITRDHGTLMKITPDGSRLEVIAAGFRAPNGMCVRADGQAVTGDNQGTWTPVDRLNWIKPGGFYGVVDLAHRDPPPTITDNPLCWFWYPSWDNSCGDPIFVTSDKWGQKPGELWYLSYGQSSLLHILPEEVDGQMQGGATRMPWHFQSGSMRARFNPADGQLYVCGFQGWQTNARKLTAFERVRYTGKKQYTPTALHVKDNTIQITFGEPLSKESAADAGAWAVEEWNYRWTGSYGTPEVKVSNPEQRGHDPVEVKSAKLSDDGKTVTLELANLQPVMQMLIRGSGIEAADGTPVDVEIVNTINTVKGKRLVVEVGKVEIK